MAINEKGWKAFFTGIRSVWKTIPADGVEPTKALVQAAYDFGLLRNQIAYCIATALWETGFTMQPVTENLNYTTIRRIRQVWPSRFPTDASAKPFVRNPKGLANHVYNGRLGNQSGSDDGWTYRGRGFVQITGRDSYHRAGAQLDVDLVYNPDLALDLRYSIPILLYGMRDGWFRPPHRLDKYMTLSKSEWTSARNIINADVRANGAKIARLADAADEALRSLEVANGDDWITKPDAPAPPEPTPPPEPAPSDAVLAQLAMHEQRLDVYREEIERLNKMLMQLWPRGWPLDTIDEGRG